MFAPKLPMPAVPCLLSAYASPPWSDGCLPVEKGLQKWGVCELSGLAELCSPQTGSILSPRNHADKQNLSQVIFVPIFYQGLMSNLAAAAVTVAGRVPGVYSLQRLEVTWGQWCPLHLIIIS